MPSRSTTSQVLRRPRGGPRRLLRRRAGRGLRLPRPQRRRQDDHDQHALHAREADRRQRARRGPRRRRRARRRPPPHRPRLPGPDARRLPDRRAEPAAARRALRRRRGLLPERMRQVLEMVDLWDRRDSPVQTFSGGMRRRLEIARGLLHSPRVLFLDEPTIGLDPQTRSSIWRYIRELKEREEITIFMTTHYMDEAEFCDRIAIMDQGEIVVLDTPAALKAQRRRGPGPDRDRRRRRGDRGAAPSVRHRGDDREGAVDVLRRVGRGSSSRGCSPSSASRSRRSACRGRRSTTSSCPTPARRSATPSQTAPHRNRMMMRMMAGRR